MPREIRIRAERRLVEMIREQKETVGLGKPGPKKELSTAKEPNYRPELKDVGIDKKLSSRSQKLAAIPEDAGTRSGRLWEWVKNG
jgi:hypothetical protein